MKRLKLSPGDLCGIAFLVLIVVMCLYHMYLAPYITSMLQKPMMKYTKEHIDIITHAKYKRMYLKKMRRSENQDKEKLLKGFMYAIINTRPEIDCTVAEKIANTILIEADKKDLDPMLIAGLIKVESNFDPFAKSSKGAIGLMQIRYSVWKETPILVKNGAEKIGGLYWIDINVSSGTDILKKYIDEAKGDVVRGLWRYNSGQTKLPPEKKEYEVDYVNKVLLATYQIRELVESHHEKFDKQYKCKYKKFIR